MDTATLVGNLAIFAFLGLGVAWVIVENWRDWFSQPRRPFRFIALGVTCLGGAAVLLDIFALRFHPAFAFSHLLFGFVSSCTLGAAKPQVGINTAYRYLTFTAPAVACLSGMFFLLHFIFLAGCCLVGFRLGEGVHGLARRIKGRKEQANESVS